MVKRFYEIGWQSNELSILDDMIAEDHIQVWQVLLYVQAAHLASGQTSALLHAGGSGLAVKSEAR